MITLVLIKRGYIDQSGERERGLRGEREREKERRWETRKGEGGFYRGGGGEEKQG